MACLVENKNTNQEEFESVSSDLIQNMLDQLDKDPILIQTYSNLPSASTPNQPHSAALNSNVPLGNKETAKPKKRTNAKRRLEDIFQNVDKENVAPVGDENNNNTAERSTRSKRAKVTLNQIVLNSFCCWCK
jgi:hypothetical protein